MKNRTRRKIFITVLSLSLAIMMIGGVTFARTVTETIQNLETGIVDIGIKEYSLTGNALDEYKNPGGLLPGQSVSIVPRITADGARCWIRAKYSFDSLKEYLNDNVFGISNQWVYKESDGYWYYKKDVKNKEYADFFQGFEVADEMTDEQAGSVFHLTVTAEAIQYAHFEPDFEAEDPWFKEKVSIVKAATYEIDESMISNERLEVVYQGGADKLIAAPDDLFSNLTQMLPGDHFSQTVNIVNRSPDRARLYFWTEAEDQNDILDKITLTISSKSDSGEQKIYSGPLRTEKLEKEKNAVLLGTYEGNQSGEMRFSLDVPADLDNQYVLNRSLVKWYFATEPIILPKKSGSAPATGDENDIGFCLLTAGGAMTVMTLAVYAYRRRRDEEN